MKIAAALLAGFFVLSPAAVLAEAGDAAYATEIPHLAAGPKLLDGTLADPLWQQAQKLDLGFDLRFNRTAAQKTTAYLLSDERALYVAFDAQQTGEIVATQHTDNVGFDTDDEVQVDLWPTGGNGIRYIFTATPLGTHYAHSTENAVYEPAWQSSGKLHPGGYTVTARIPYDILRGDGRKNWNLQLVRFVQRTNELYVWSHKPGQSDHNDAAFAGTLGAMLVSAKSSRPQPRIALFGLGEAGSTSRANGYTSRGGADIALPLTQTASLIATIHPDYSNVEVDQQTISPTAYQRSFNEVRPFFTQGANYYNAFDCDVCPGVTELYTPNIPTPDRGYAIEGTQGPATFAAFDAIGQSRHDIAQSLSLKNGTRTFGVSYQGVTSLAPGFADRLTTLGTFFTDRKHLAAYANYGYDRGTNVVDGAQAQRLDAGGAFYGNDYFFGGGVRKIGKYYDPVDGLVTSPDIAGYSFFADRTLRFEKRAPVKSFELQYFLERYHDQTGRLDRTGDDLQATVVTRTNFKLAWDTGTSLYRLPSGVMTPVTTVGPGVWYLAGSSTPSALMLNHGRFGDGRLMSWTRSTAFKLANYGFVNLEADDTFWSADAGYRNTQWLERASFTKNIDAQSSFALGVRKIVGNAPPLYGPQPFVNASNVSFGYSKHTRRDEIYFVYGDSSRLDTKPGFTLKYIYYLGGQKGT
ncbi:MAG: hypothetical protein NVSMB64_17410 [Candidatus Velthaea sp.]